MNVAFLLIAGVLVMLSGLFSGLNLGLMSFSDEDLRIIIEGSPSAVERRDAATIAPLRRTGNLLLCTLLLGNTLVNAMIAILLSDMTDGIVGGLVTTALIVVFGEIIPQSVCSRYALRIGARSVPVVWAFVGLCYVLAWPIARVLDYALGREMNAVYTKNELQSLIKLNVEDADRQLASGLAPADGRILTGALAFREKSVDGAMTPLDSTFCLPRDAVLDEATISRILRSGHTRIPVLERVGSRNVVAVLYAKDLVGIGFERMLPLARILDCFHAEQRVMPVDAGTTLGAAFDLCKKCRCHMLVVVDKTERMWPAVGVLTTEDVLEEIIQDEIVGDDDDFIDVAAISTNRPGIARKNSHAYDRNALIAQLAADTSAESYFGAAYPSANTLVSAAAGDVELHSLAARPVHDEKDASSVASCFAPDAACVM